jgi:hypothetical protein
LKLGYWDIHVYQQLKEAPCFCGIWRLAAHRFKDWSVFLWDLGNVELVLGFRRSLIRIHDFTIDKPHRLWLR